jgi:hypothetical protein
MEGNVVIIWHTRWYVFMLPHSASSKDNFKEVVISKMERSRGKFLWGVKLDEILMNKYLKESLLPMVTGTTVMTIGCGIALYIYLRQIGWPELLQPALLSPVGVGTVVVAMIVMILACAATFYASAYWLKLFADSFKGGYEVPRKIELIIFLIHLMWTGIIFLTFIPLEKFQLVCSRLCEDSAGWLDSHVTRTATTFMCCVSAGMFLYGIARAVRGGRAKKPTMVTVGRKRGFWHGMKRWLFNFFGNVAVALPYGVRGFLIAMASFSSSLAALAFIEMNPAIGDHEFSWTTSSIVWVTMWPGIMMGVTYVKQRRKTDDEKSALKACLTVGAAISLWAIFNFPSAFLVPLDFFSLGLASIYSNEPHHYQLMKKDARSAYEYVGFSSRYGDPYIITAYDRFRFGDVLLVCVAPYDPLRTVTADVQRWGHDDNGCVSADKSELRRVDPPNWSY